MINPWSQRFLTYCAWVMHIYASVIYVSFDSVNSPSPIQSQAIILTNAGLLLIGPLQTHFSDMWMTIKRFSRKKK